MFRNYHQAGTFLDRINPQHPLHRKVPKTTLVEWMTHYDDERVWPTKQTAKEKTEILAGGEFLRKYGQIKEYVLTLSSQQLNLLVDLFHLEPNSTDHDDLVGAVVDYAHTLDDPSDSESETANLKTKGPKKLISPADRSGIAGARSPSGSSSNASDDSQDDEPATPHHDLFEITETSLVKKAKKAQARDEESVIDTSPNHQPKVKKGKTPAPAPEPEGNDSDSSITEHARRVAYDKARAVAKKMKKAGSGAKDDDSTDFRAYNRANEDEVCGLCQCKLCKEYMWIRTVSVKKIMSACADFTPPFKTLQKDANVELAREFFAAVWWSVHHHEYTDWKSLKDRERTFLANCMDLPATWAWDKRLKMAQVAVEGCLVDIIPLLNKAVGQGAPSSATAHIAAGSPAKIASAGVSAHATAGSPSKPPSQQAIVRRLLSMAVNPLKWLSRTETKELLAASRVAKLSGAANATMTLPYGDYPWGQSLRLESEAPVDMIQVGRRLNIAGRNSTSAFNSPMESLARESRKSEEDRIFAEFDAAFETKNLAEILLSAEHIKTFHYKILESSVTQAEAWAEQHNITLTQEVLAGRKRQQGEFNDFFAAINLWVQLGAAAQTAAKRDTYIIGAWSGFFQGLRSSHFCQDFTEATLARGQGLTAATSKSSPIQSSDSEDCDFASEHRAKKRTERTEAKKKRKTAPSNTSSSGGGKAGVGGRGPKVVFQKHFHCSDTIIGPKLGVSCSAIHACRHCGKMGHWSGECGKGWYDELKVQLPGYSKEGRRLLNQWDDNKNPRQACAREWVKFLQTKKNFPDGGLLALEQGAPSLSAYVTWAGKAQK